MSASLLRANLLAHSMRPLLDFGVPDIVEMSWSGEGNVVFDPRYPSYLIVRCRVAVAAM